MLTYKAVAFAVVLAGFTGWFIRVMDAMWIWPLAALIVITAWWLFGQRTNPPAPPPCNNRNHTSSDIFGGL